MNCTDCSLFGQDGTEIALLRTRVDIGISEETLPTAGRKQIGGLCLSVSGLKSGKSHVPTETYLYSDTLIDSVLFVEVLD